MDTEGVRLTRTLFIKKDKKESCCCQVFQMSSMGELIFFLGFVKTAITPMETKMALIKYEEADEVDYVLVLVFRESSFDLEAFSDSDYAGANLDRKSITGGCQFLGSRLISWQCKKQTIVATSTTEAEYVATQVAVDKYCGFRIKCRIMVSIS
ncbi:hypothetical protein Tco_0955439 [Tanacetum coccineum]|uniref:Uncharacterized protein n=1 Tax=Tanacetum coccineum TaxID=301880 RepID=A0ABQ5E773_9ASTR